MRWSSQLTPLAIVSWLLINSGAALSQTMIESELYKQFRSADRVRVIILTKADPDQASGGAAHSNAASYLSSALGTSANNVKSMGKIPGVSAEITADALARLREDPNVALVTRDIPMPALLFDSVPMMGANSYHTKGIRGTGYNVAVLDTGVDKSHPALANLVLTEACFSTAKSDVNKVKSLCPQGLEESGGIWERRTRFFFGANPREHARY